MSLSAWRLKLSAENICQGRSRWRTGFTSRTKVRNKISSDIPESTDLLRASEIADKNGNAKMCQEAGEHRGVQEWHPKSSLPNRWSCSCRQMRDIPGEFPVSIVDISENVGRLNNISFDQSAAADIWHLCGPSVQNKEQRFLIDRCETPHMEHHG